MEAPQQNHHHGDDGSNNNNNMKPPPSFLCRQSSSRWTPTTDQIRILKDLYYNNGIRSPSADQIQRISARLRQYGKIEGKNVFYWFQNHKARERQKKRFTTTTTTTTTTCSASITANTTTDHLHLHNNGSQQRNNGNAVNPSMWRSSSSSDQDHHNSIFYNTTNNYPPNSITTPAGVIPSSSSPPSHGVFAAVGQMGSYGGYGSVAMEKSFRECSISPKDHSRGGSIDQNVSVPSPYPFLDKINSSDDQVEEVLEEYQDDDEELQAREIETLPLFPMHGEDQYYGSSSSGYSCVNNFKPPESSSSGGHNNYYGGWYQSEIGGSARASLELSLNSCITGGRSTHYFY